MDSVVDKIVSSSSRLQPCPVGARACSWQINGRELQGLVWGEAAHPAVLALHGWLDNALSFAELAPRLAEAGYQVIAIDWAGHGLSDWRDQACYWHQQDVLDLDALLDQLDASPLPIIAHSMGAGLAGMLAAAAPEKISQLILIDGLGLLSSEPEATVPQLNQALQAQRKRRARVRSSLHYRDLDAAISARQKGMFPLTEKAAWQLCQRGLRAEGQGWCWSSDPRLLLPSPVRLTEAQNQAYLAQLKLPVTLLVGQQGVFAQGDRLAARVACIPHIEVIWREGGHHLHLEQASASACAAVILKALKQGQDQPAV